MWNLPRTVQVQLSPMRQVYRSKRKIASQFLVRGDVDNTDAAPDAASSPRRGIGQFGGRYELAGGVPLLSQTLPNYRSVCLSVCLSTYICMIKNTHIYIM